MIGLFYWFNIDCCTVYFGALFGVLRASCIVIGSSNTVESKSLVIGDNNTVTVGIDNVLVVGTNLTPTTDGIWADNINGIPASTLTSGLPGVLSINNTTGGNSIIMSSGDAITSPSGTNFLIIDDTFNHLAYGNTYLYQDTNGSFLLNNGIVTGITTARQHVS